MQFDAHSNRIWLKFWFLKRGIWLLCSIMVLFIYFESQVSKHLKIQFGHDRTVLFKDRTVLFESGEILSWKSAKSNDRSVLWLTELGFTWQKCPFFWWKRNRPFQQNYWLELSFSQEIMRIFYMALNLVSCWNWMFTVSRIKYLKVFSNILLYTCR